MGPGRFVVEPNRETRLSVKGCTDTIMETDPAAGRLAAFMVLIDHEGFTARTDHPYDLPGLVPPNGHGRHELFQASSDRPVTSFRCRDGRKGNIGGIRVRRLYASGTSCDLRKLRLSSRADSATRHPRRSPRERGECVAFRLRLLLRLTPGAPALIPVQRRPSEES